MGDIIRFRPRQGARPTGTGIAQAGSAGTGSAQILLFLGVRYERHQEEGVSRAKNPSRPGSRRKRA